METLLTFLFTAAVTWLFFQGYKRNLQKKETQWREAAEAGQMFSEGPRAQHPKIDITHCIGCAACTQACPEGDVLGMIGGKATIVNASRCIGHALCADACPVGAITMVRASASVSAEMPHLTPEYETTVPNLFVVGELGGLALIKNAVNQGRDCIDTITSRTSRIARVKTGGNSASPDIYDVIIVGAGPAGISASLRAIENRLHYLTIEQDELGGTVAKYPRQKLILTSPVEFPLYGKFTQRELSKENLLSFWRKVLQRADFKVRTGEKVDDIQVGKDGIFSVTTASGRHCGRAVVLALGRAGTPKKLGIEGEELAKVMYRLIEADHYTNQRILVVGGGDSAIEAALGLASQHGNEVTLSYRRESFARIKRRNATRIDDFVRRKKIRVLFHSTPVRFLSDTVTLEVDGQLTELGNDFVWIFAGGTAPNEFLRKIGVGLGDSVLQSEPVLLTRVQE